MNAKSNDLSRLQEIYDIVVQTKNQIESVGSKALRAACVAYGDDHGIELDRK
ncbi:MAG: hypothetical protein RR547_05820 [Raoultibacter sp.]